MVYKICFNVLDSPEEAEDMCQETYISLYINLDKYESLEENDLKNLICKIALNKCRDFLRTKKSKNEELADDKIIQIEDLKRENKLDENVIEKEKEEKIREEIYSLKEPYKTIIYEYYINEKTLDEIAIKMKSSKGTVKTQLYRGKEILRRKYKKIRR